MSNSLVDISIKNSKSEMTSILNEHGLTYSGIAKTLDGIDHHGVKRALDPIKSRTAGWLMVERVRNRTADLLNAAGYKGDINKIFPTLSDINKDAA